MPRNLESIRNSFCVSSSKSLVVVFALLLILPTIALAQTSAAPKSAPAEKKAAPKKEPPAPKAPTFSISQKIDEAAAAFQGGSYERAISLFREITAADPKNVLAWHFLGQSLEKLGDKEGSTNAYKQVLALQPEGPVADRTRQLLRAANRPKFPAVVNSDVVRTIELSPLFASLPLARKPAFEQRYESETRYFTTRTGKTEVMRIRVPDPDQAQKLQFQNEDLGGNGYLYRYQNPNGTGFSIGIGGLVPVFLYSKDGDTTQETTAISLSSGMYYPFKVGNSYRMEYQRKGTEPGRSFVYEHVETCNVTEVLPGLQVHPNIPGEIFVVRCSHSIKSQDSSKPSFSESIRLCSNQLETCPFWLPAKIERIPDLSKGFTFVEEHSWGTTTMIQGPMALEFK